MLRHFGVTRRGNFEHGATVLEVAVPVRSSPMERDAPVDAVERELAPRAGALFDAREKRVKPGRDDKILAGWNGLMIRGLAFARARLRAPGVGARWRGARGGLRARRAVGRAAAAALVPGGQRRASTGFLEDYGDFAVGAHRALPGHLRARSTWRPRRALVKRAVDARSGTRRSRRTSPRRTGQKDLLVATYALFDNAFPSGASHAHRGAGGARRAHRGQVPAGAARALPAQDARADRGRTRWATGTCALAADALLDGAAGVTFAGTREQVAPLRLRRHRVYAPTFAFGWKEPGAPVPPLLKEIFEGREPVGGQGAAYLCRGFVCERPIRLRRSWATPPGRRCAGGARVGQEARFSHLLRADDALEARSSREEPGAALFGRDLGSSRGGLSPPGGGWGGASLPGHHGYPLVENVSARGQRAVRIRTGAILR